MLNFDIFSIILVLLFSTALAYKASFLQNKTIGHLSLLQMLYLVVIPGILFILLNSYIQSIVIRPPASQMFLPDQLLTNLILLALFFTYGGLAVHAVTKMLSTQLRYDDSEAGELNRYFHLTFSHNLYLSGALLVMIGLMLLELNHQPGIGYTGWFAPVWRGLIMGLLFVFSVYMYTRSKDDYSGHWSDLKATFFVFWVGFILILYIIQKFVPAIRHYQLLFPALIGFCTIAILNVVLVVRRLANSRYEIKLRLRHLLEKF